MFQSEYLFNTKICWKFRSVKYIFSVIVSFFSPTVATGSKDPVNQIVTAQVKKLLEKHKLPYTIISVLLDVKMSTVSGILAGRQGWTIANIATLAEYFGVTLDELVFGDKHHIEKTTARQKREAVEDIYMSLVRDGNTNTLGKLMADGFFKDVDIQYLSQKVKEQK